MDFLNTTQMGGIITAVYTTLIHHEVRCIPDNAGTPDRTFINGSQSYETQCENRQHPIESDRNLEHELISGKNCWRLEDA